MSEFYTIGFTGTREGMSQHQKSALTYFLRDFHRPCIFRHGDCIGADYTAHGIAKKLGFRIIIHPPDSPSMRGHASGAFSVLQPKPYLDRNMDIVKESERIFAAVKGDEEVRSGTWATIRYAGLMNIPTTILYPDGTYEDRFPWEM